MEPGEARKVLSQLRRGTVEYCVLSLLRGDRETGRQIALYSLILVAITLAFFSVARMGFVYLAVAVVLGTVFVYQAFGMWRDGTPARAMRRAMLRSSSRIPGASM